MAARTDEDRARILAEAEASPDAKVAKAHGITVRVLQMWRKRAREDAEFSALFAGKAAVVRGVVEQLWQDTAREALSDMVAKLRELVLSVPVPPERGQIHEVAGAIKIVGELDLAKTALTPDVARGDREGRTPAPHAGPDGRAAQEEPRVH